MNTDTHPPHTSECRATLSRSRSKGGTVECLLVVGHAGDHANGSVEWPNGCTPAPIAPATPTPGPWRVDYRLDGKPYIQSVHGRIAGPAYGPTGIDSGDVANEERANAVLLAAAPELRDALADVQRYCPVHVQDQIRALLARLAGGSPDGR
jgi:hypothetical protein